MQDKIKAIIKQAIDELNEQLEEKIDYTDNVKLMGKGAVMDSMDFVTLVTIIEEMISNEFDKDIRLVSDKAFSRENSPFNSIQTLTYFVIELLESE